MQSYNSSEFFNQAQILLNEWNLLEFLSNYGDASVVGSAALDLMTWGDIDIDVVCKTTPTKDDAIEVSKYIYNIEGFRKLTLIDYFNSDGLLKPKGLYIGGRFVDTAANDWKIDVWLLATDFSIAREKTEELRKILTTEHRKAILEIKSKICDLPQYRKEIFSVDIYDAVIYHSVTNIEGFKTYLSNKGIVLML